MITKQPEVFKILHIASNHVDFMLICPFCSKPAEIDHNRKWTIDEIMAREG